MKNKRIFNLISIIIGIFICFGFSKVQATEIISTFTGETLTRTDLQAVATANTLNATTTPKVLGISKNRQTKDWYAWNPKSDAIDENANLIVDENGNVQAQKVWKIATYPSTTSDTANYNDLYYCLNASRGFGISNGEMAEGKKDQYPNSFDMNDSSNKSNIINYAGENLGTNYNKILWIIDNSYIPTGKADYQASNEYKNLMNKADILIDTDDNRINLTEDDIEVVQQMAIWYFTNSDNSNYNNSELPSLYLNGKQLSSIYLYTTENGEQITGAKRQEKAEKLYKYLITNASSTYTKAIPTLRIIDNATIVESGDNYIVGPYDLSGDNLDNIKSIEVTNSHNYTLLDASKNTVNNNDFTKVLGKSFYLQVPKSEITSTTEFKLNLAYSYNDRNLTFMTDIADPENTQPVVNVKNEEKKKNIEIVKSIGIVNKTVEKDWDDNDNQDGVRLDFVKVQLYKNGEVEGNAVVLNTTNNWTYTWSNLLDGYTYTVKELDSNNIAVENDGRYNDNYTATYGIEGNKTTIINKHIPEVISKTVKKVWDDNNNQDEVRPDSVQVTLYKTVNKIKQKVEEIELNSANNWEYTWNALSKYENGKEIVYTVEEAVPNNYDVSYSEDTFTITNKYTPGTVSKTVVKVWDDKDNADGIRPESVTVQLYADGKKYGEEVVLNKENGFTYTWLSLPERENGVAINYTVSEIKIGNDKVENNSTEKYNVTYKIEENVITITNTHEVIPKKFDLALRKFITKVNDEDYSREPVVDTSTIATTGTATYKHIKQPIAVQKGDVVTYTIRVYNEGELDGYVDKITDHLPDNLIPIIDGIEGIDSEKYKEEIEFNSKYSWIYTDKGNTITTMATSKNNSDIYGMMTRIEEITDTKLDAYVEDSDKLDYIDVQIKCLVTDNAVSGEYLTNIAEITEAQDINGVKGDGSDSEVANADISNLADYRNEEAINSTVDTYIQGQEDDDDFEKLVVKEFDLALRKFITKVNETLYSREPVVDTSKLRTTVDGKAITTAIYNHSKEPVIVERGDLVTYKIRIYNEGTLDGFVNEITDNIPEGLEFLPDSSVNVSYKWRMIDSEGNETEDVSKAVIIVTDYLSDNDKNNVIKASSDVDGVKTLSYKDVEVQFKVIAKAEKLKDNLIINEAQISADSDRDIDSVPNRDEKYNYTAGNNEDDIDYEPIKLKYFDLALRKFITKVNSVDYNNRYPEVVYNEDGSITYNHTKDPVLVTTGDTVIYTIRVYNEGEKDGTATEITDNLPEGLEFLPDNEINKQYSWKLIDEEGNITEDITKAKKFATEALKDEIIDALIIKDGQKVLSYKDVQIAFKVIETNTSAKILINKAEISEDSDDDVDSTPENGIETEDDTDKEYVKVQYFDLSIKKWITASKVTYNGKTTTTKTGFADDSEGIAKVDLVASKMKKTTVKFVYSIKVTNEGELPGYAYEVKDYIPKGLKFVAEDNKDWKELEDGTVVTEKLKETLLNPGESATVEIVLTWKNSTTNTGLKTNYAEISKDSADDIDSTPDNYNLKEDDIDDAQILLSIKTAGTKTYIGLVLLTVTILAGGIFLIKKYVIK